MAAWTLQYLAFDRPPALRRARRAVAHPILRTPNDALRLHIAAAERGFIDPAEPAQELLLITDPSDAMALLFLSYAARAQAAGVSMRMILAQRARSWGWWRAAPRPAALDLLGPDRLRVIDGPTTSQFYNHAIFGRSALWTGYRIGRRGLNMRLEGIWRCGRLTALPENAEGCRRAQRAVRRFDAAWAIGYAL